MAKAFRGVVNLDIRDSIPDWGPYAQPKAPPGSPNVLYIVLDDVGYSALGCYGDEIRPAPHARSLEAVRAAAVRWGATAGLAAAEAFEIVRVIR